MLFMKNLQKISLCTACPSAKGQMDKTGDQLVNIVEHLEAKKPDVSLRRQKKPKTKLKTRVNTGLTSSSGDKHNPKKLLKSVGYLHNKLFEQVFHDSIKRSL